MKMAFLSFMHVDQVEEASSVSAFNSTMKKQLRIHKILKKISILSKIFHTNSIILSKSTQNLQLPLPTALHKKSM